MMLINMNKKNDFLGSFLKLDFTISIFIGPLPSSAVLWDAGTEECNSRSRFQCNFGVLNRGKKREGHLLMKGQNYLQLHESGSSVLGSYLLWASDFEAGLCLSLIREIGTVDWSPHNLRTQ
jgi:hypothetical protein